MPQSPPSKSRITTPHFELHAETGKQPKNTEQEEIFRKVKSLEQSLRNIQGLGGQVSVAYKDLCLFIDVQLPARFKMPKFDLYDRHGDPVAHLRGFCSKMRGAGGRDKLLMTYFSQSLSGAALEGYTRQDNSRWYTWDDLAHAFARHFQYNVEIVPDRLSLTKIEKKPSESLREYGFRWREQGLRQLDVLRPIESKLPNPSPKNLDYSLKCSYCSDALGYDTEKCWHLKSSIQELIDTNKIVVQSPEDGEPKKPSKTVMMIRASESNPVKTLVVTKATSSIAEGLTDKLSTSNDNPHVVVAKGFPDDVETKQGKPKVVVLGVASKSVIIVEGACIAPVIIKPVTQLLIDNTKVVPWNYKRVIVTYKGKEVEEEVNETRGLTRSGRYFGPVELRKVKPLKDNPILVKKPATEEEAEEFLRKMKEHRRALVKILNEAHVPDKITVNHLEKIANKIFEANEITFSDDELPLEGTEHNRALYLRVKCEDFVVTRVLADNGYSANICPLSTLQKLKIDTERIYKNNVCVRGFDGGGKDSVGDIVFELTIGPVEFTMEFQVLDMVASYNLVLGRPWIHVGKAVLSSLHQMVKFEWDRQEIVVHGDDNLCAYNDTSIPFIEAEDDEGPWVYQVSKIASVEKVP
ncbi:PREDICTED: uncharacterized protein LOC109231713 [Nicotiana attenuata]|uniref:uncharacterized protein LOC109231713 n=1 Tax=Nicotiana attenuata TaxID=49451 RepID=UPI000905970D|nr:PREDICTED: uncharacterized protein LOC109231713 [Nicotiana attenuata]